MSEKAKKMVGGGWHSRAENRCPDCRGDHRDRCGAGAGELGDGGKRGCAGRGAVPADQRCGAAGTENNGKLKGGKSMKNNRFYDNRMEIKKLAEERHATVDVATRMYIKEHQLKDYGDELKEWDKLCRDYMQSKDKTLADLFR